MKRSEIDQDEETSLIDSNGTDTWCETKECQERKVSVLEVVGEDIEEA